MTPYTVKDIETFAENIPGAEGLAIANDGRVLAEHHPGIESGLVSQEIGHSLGERGAGQKVKLSFYYNGNYIW